MRLLGSVLGVFFIVVGSLVSVGGCAVSSTYLADGMFFWSGLVVTILGWALSGLSNTTECSMCKQTVIYSALKCRHCGSELGDAYNAAPRPA
jgi:hypothetical protein